MVKSSSYYRGVQSCCCTYGPAIVCGTNLYISGSITLLWNISSRLSVGLKGCMLGMLIYRWWNLGDRKATVRPFSCHSLEDAALTLRLYVCPNSTNALKIQLNKGKLLTLAPVCPPHLSPPAPVHDGDSLFQRDTSPTVTLKNKALP